ncbi:MAG: hypothetical protein ACFFED_16455 [Candidatus Thorarchaeota archaeon]
MRCPVCGDPATDEGTVPAMSAMDRGISQEATRHSSFAGSGHFMSRGRSGYFGSSQVRARLGAVNRFTIPACERHAISFEETARLRAPCGVCNGLLIILTIFLSVSILGSMLVGGPDLMILVLFGLSVIGLVITWIGSGPTGLEKSVKVLDSTEGFGMMVLEIRSKEYADELLRLNPMSAKLLKVTRSF